MEAHASRPSPAPVALRAILPFAAGVWLAERLATGALTGAIPRGIEAPALAVGAVLLPAGILGRRRGALFLLLLLAAGFLRGMAAFTARPDPLVEEAALAGEMLVVSGRVAGSDLRPDGSHRVLLRPARAASDSTRARVSAAWSVTWPESLAAPLPGAGVLLRLAPRRVRGPTNPGGWDQRRHEARRGVLYQARLARRSDILVLRPVPPWHPERLLAGLRAAMGSSIDRRLAGFPGRLARVLLIGDRVNFHPDEEADFRGAGVTHILSVSGMHVGLVAATVQLLVGRRRRPGGLLVSLLLIWAYTLVVGGPSAAVRSAAMLTLVLTARHLRRHVAGPALLSGAALLLLVLSPGLLFDLGFLLSTLSVAGLLAGHAALSRIPGMGRAPAPVRVLAEALALTLSAQTATAPLTVPLFGNWPVVAPLGNLLVVGVSDLVLTGGFLGLALDLLYPAAADRVFAAVWGLGKLVGFLVHQLAVHSPGVTGLTPPPVGVPFLFYVAAGILILRAAGGARRRETALWAAASAAMLGLLVAAPPGRPPGLRITVLDVGQGDATLIEMPDGRTFMVDAGEGGAADTGGRVVLPALRAARRMRLSAVILSHEHLDHFGGLFKVLEGVRVERVFDSGFGPDGAADEFRDLCLAQGAPVCLSAAGDTLLAGGDYAIRVLWPPRPVDPADDYARPANRLNDLSLVLEMTWRGHRFILPGDAEANAESHLLPALAPGPVDWLKSGHHGSRTSSTVAWLERLRPRLVTISAGRRNRFHHPSPEIVERYREMGIPVHRTDTQGALRLTWLRGGLRFEEWGDGLDAPPRRGFIPEGEPWPGGVP